LTRDSLADEMVNWATGEGIPVGGYHWTDPTVDVTSQVAFIRSTIDYFKPLCWYGDFEQYWKDWAAYMRQDLAEAYRTRFTPAQLESFHLRFWNAVEAVVRDIPIGIYSADWYMLKYAPKLRPWVITKNYWEARYTRYYDPNIDKLFIGQGEIEPSEFKRIAFNNLLIPNGIMRQFTSYALVKGFGQVQGYHLDWNIMTDLGFEAMFKPEIIVVPPPPDPPIPPTPPTALYRVKAYACWIRDEPMGLKLGYKWKGERVQVIEIVDAGVLGKWVRTPEGYMGLSALELFIDLV